MSDFLSILLVLLYAAGWYLTVTYRLFTRDYRKKKRFDFDKKGKHLVISVLVFFVILTITLTQVKRHYKKHMPHAKHVAIKADLEEEEEE